MEWIAALAGVPTLPIVFYAQKELTATEATAQSVQTVPTVSSPRVKIPRSVVRVVQEKPLPQVIHFATPVRQARQTQGVDLHSEFLFCPSPSSQTFLIETELLSLGLEGSACRVRGANFKLTSTATTVLCAFQVRAHKSKLYSFIVFFLYISLLE